MIIFLSQVIVNIDPINMARILFVFYTLTQMSVVSIIYSKDSKSHFIDLTEFVISSCVCFFDSHRMYIILFVYYCHFHIVLIQLLIKMK